jgi:dihydroorotase
VLVDLKRRETIRAERLASRCGWTPFEGKEVTGWPVMTILRGAIAMREGELIGAPRGEPVRFIDTLAQQE